MNPIRWLKNLFVDCLLTLSGTWIGSPKDLTDNNNSDNNSDKTSDATAD